jgi:gamma-F420-2:alpha-L-glutamate ligase
MKNMKKLNGWILYAEHVNESYELDRLLEYAKQSGDIELEVYHPSDFDIFLSNEKDVIYVNGQKKKKPDFFYPKMGAGTTYFAFSVIREFERMGVKVINKSSSIELVKDKLYTQQILSRHGLNTPKTLLLKHPISVDLVEEQIGFPCIIKTLSGSQGSGVFMSNTKNEFKTITDILKSTQSNANLIIQEFMSDSHGRDLRVYVLGGRPIIGMLRESQDGGFRANISIGGKGTKFELTEELKWISTKISKILDLDICGIDFLFNGDDFYICEVNSNPGFKGLETIDDINIPEKIFNWLKVELM